MRVVVTGAKRGSELEQLLARGDAVVAGVRRPETAPERGA